MNRSEIIKDALRRFPHQPKRTIARYILNNYGALFDGDLEKIRSNLRYYTGTYGDKNRVDVKELIEHKVVIPKTLRETRTPYKLKPGKWLLLADVHIPFHEIMPIEVAIRHGQDNNVDGVLLCGDTQDCAAIGFWPTRVKRDFDKEMEASIDFLDFISQAFPKKQKVYKMGNHEARLDRYYQVHAPELTGIPLEAARGALGLDERGYDVVDEKQMILAGKLPVFHGHEFRNLHLTVNPARGLFLKTKSWALCAHCHRTSENSATNIMGTYLTTWSVGCLCNLSPDYNPFGNDWCWGVSIINIEKNGDFDVSNRRILPNGKIV